MAGNQKDEKQTPERTEGQAMQIVSQEERYLKAIHRSGLCAGLCRKLGILSQHTEKSFTARAADVRTNPSLLRASPEPIDAAKVCAEWIEEQRVIERMQRAVGHM